MRTNEYTCKTTHLFSSTIKIDITTINPLSQAKAINVHPTSTLLSNIQTTLLKQVEKKKGKKTLFTQLTKYLPTTTQIILHKLLSKQTPTTQILYTNTLHTNTLNININTIK
jgi:uncharacterized metal-binding protein